MTRFISASVALLLASLVAGACAPMPPAQRIQSVQVSDGGAWTYRASTSEVPIDAIEYQGLRYIRLKGAHIQSVLSESELRYVPGSVLSKRYVTETFFPAADI